MTFRALFGVGLVLSLSAGVAAAQSLGELAEKEKKRREELKKQQEGDATSFSDEDLTDPEGAKPAVEEEPETSVEAGGGGETRPPVRGRFAPPRKKRPPSQGTAPAGEPQEGVQERGDEPQAEAAEQEGVSTPGSVEAGDEPIWRAQYQELQQAVAAAQAELNEAERALQAATRGPMRQPQPGEAFLQDPDSRLTRDASLDDLVKKRDEAKEALEAAQADLADFREQARRKGVPPGWIR
jgi:hypothetical protein